MPTLSPAGAQVLAAHNDGVVNGHPTVIAPLLVSKFVRKDTTGGTLHVTPAGWTALAAWHDELEESSPLPCPSRARRTLPRVQHEAVVTAARRPDQLVPGRDDHAVYWSGEKWFNQRTLNALQALGYADGYPIYVQGKPTPWETHGGPLHLTPAGRQYARERGGVDVRRRRIVLIACGQKKAP
ncbi:hypothetical protein [Streptomyces goshikiensis]|uniref:hypothetical protein n=1 Tax=Streptomyces goshikiensis TaxID=1942 RepID=UPI003678106F